MADKNEKSDNQQSKDENQPKKNEDTELDDLLDSALQDLDKPPASENASNSMQLETTNSSRESTWTEEFCEESPDMEKILENLLGKNPESMEELEKLTQMFNNPSGDSNEVDLNALTQEFLSNLSSSATNRESNDENLSQMLGSMGLSEGDESMPSLVQNMMQMLLSKDLLYPALKDITEKYPNWLSENKETTDEEQFKKYETQYELMKQICSEFEVESQSDSDQVKKARFEGILELMQKMQDCGNPPSSLVGDGGFDLGDSGMAKMAALSGNEKCEIM